MSEDQHLMDLPAAKKQKLDDSIREQTETSAETTENGVSLEISDKEPTGDQVYSNLVTPEEFEKLREFKVLDEVKSNDEDSNDEDSDSSDAESEGLPEEEIEKMLEEDLPEGFKGAPKPKEKAYVTRQKIVLEEKGINHFEVLPLDWIMVRHISGMPIYMHRGSRVCTLSKPYFLGKGNIRRHDIPLSAIPCFAYRRALEEEEKQQRIDQRIEEQIRNGTWVNRGEEETRSQNGEGTQATDESSTTGTLDINVPVKVEYNSEEMTCPFANGDVEPKVEVEEEAIPVNRQPVVLPGGIVMPPPRVETINTSWKTQHLTAEQINDYCKKLFKFKTINIMQFKRWADRRKYTKARKTLQYPTLPEDTKLITIPAQPVAPGQENGGKANKRDWVMNLNDRSYLSVFHEYVRRALQKQPVYEFKQLENASTPYQATVYIGGMQYGVGHGSSKRQAKSAAARASIHILIPEMKDELDKHAPHAAPAPDTSEPDFTFFDYVGIEDPRITEFCAATCEPSPHAILRTCLLRNFGAGDRHMIHTEMKKLEYQKIELTMKVGKHTATVVCKNKKTAKQRASQSILQALHPHVRSWGSLLRLYGSRSVKSCKEKKLEEQHITLLQDKARHNEPNYAVLEKLRNEMKKLRERDEAVVPIGTLLVSDDLPTHSGSNLNNVDL